MKLAIFLPNWVGDACMAIPALRALRKGLSRNTTFLGVSRPGPAALLAEQSWFEDWLVYKPRSKGGSLNRRGLVRELRRQKCDAAILLTNSLSSAAIAAVSQIPRRVGYARDGRSWLLTDRLNVQRSFGRPLPVPAIDYFLGLAGYFGCPSVDRQMEMTVADKYIKQASELWKSLGFSDQRPTVVLNNNTANCPERLWPEEYAVKLATKIATKLDVQVLLHCSASEAPIANRIAQAANHPLVQSMGRSNELPFGLSQAVFAKASTIVTTDSGARHLAIAMNRPVITLFGATQPCWTTTYNLPETIVQAEPRCAVCSATSLRKNGSGRGCECMRRIKPERVFLHVINRLKSWQNPAWNRAA